MLMQILAAIVLIAVCGGLCYSLLLPPAVFVVRLSRGGVRFAGRFPAAKRHEVESFLTREFADRGRISISALKAKDGRMRLVVRGRLSEGDRQRIRNFFQVIG